MTYREHSAHLAGHLAELASSAQTLDLDDHGLAVALLGRAETIKLTRAAMTAATGRHPAPDTTSAHRQGARLSLQGAVDNPVFTFERVLKDYPLPRGAAAYRDVPRHTVGSPVELWRQVARSAIIAGHDLHGEKDAITGAGRWTLVADSAALARTIHALDSELGEVADRLGNAQAAQLREAGRRPLRLTADEALTLARSGPLPDLAAIDPTPRSHRPIMVDSPMTLLEAQRRLPLQVKHAREVQPEAILFTALGQAQILQLAASTLGNDPDQEARAARAANVAERLGQIRPETREITALLPGDERAVTQTRLIVRYLHHNAGAIPVEPRLRQALAAVVDRTPQVIRQLSESATRHLSSGRWLVSYGEEDQALWRRITPADDLPRLNTDLRAAAGAIPLTGQPITVRSRLAAAHDALQETRPGLVPRPTEPVQSPPHTPQPRP